MDRTIIYDGEGLRSDDFLLGARAALIGLAKLSESVFGSSTVVDGLGCAPATGLNVSIAAGAIYSPAVVDATTYGTVAADGHTVLKQGLLLDPVNLSCPAPVSSGQSINYLVEVQFQENDAGSTSLPFYDSSNPAVPIFSNGNTLRKDICAVQLKAGASATTGTQVTPTPDAGWTGLWVITVAYGQTSISVGAITAYPGAPFISARARDLAMLLTTWTATGTANALVVTPAPALGAYTAGLTLSVLAPLANTGAVTVNFSTLGAKSIVHFDGSALAAGEIATGAVLKLVYDGTRFIWADAPYGPTPPAGTSSQRLATMASISGSRTYQALTATTATPLTANTSYLVDTASGAVSAPLPATAALDDRITIIDGTQSWATNNLTLTRNGNTIMGFAEDLVCDIADAEFTIRWNGSDWRLV